MNRFARLLEALVFTPGRNGKLRLLEHYFAVTGDPERGYALAALTGTLSLATAKPAVIRALVAERVDPVLFDLSYDFVGDLAETVALIWPEAERKTEAVADSTALDLTEVITTLQRSSRTEVARLLGNWLDRLDATGRHALLKLITGGLRVGVSARLAKTALANWSGHDLTEIEELWHAQTVPYEALFAWLEHRGNRPAADLALSFRPLMLANPLEDRDVTTLDATQYRAEWKWDGIRIQVVGHGDTARLYSRTGDEIGATFPDVRDTIRFHAVLDGELLVLDGDRVAAFADLQQRLNRKTVSPKLMRERPAHVRLYDILVEDGDDLRSAPFDVRRTRLERWFARIQPERMDLSPLIPFRDWAELVALRDSARARAIEGLMLKRADGAYIAGRPVGPWWKWKRDPLTADAVLMYAQRGHGKRSSFYSDFTFGAWRQGALVPIGKAYFGFTDVELHQLDRWVREHTLRSYGPVREVEPSLVLEVAFDSIQRSNRHKSGLAMRFPRIHRIRWDKPAQEADRLESLERLIDA